MNDRAYAIKPNYVSLNMTDKGHSPQTLDPKQLAVGFPFENYKNKIISGYQKFCLEQLTTHWLFAKRRKSH